jgi:hypothetical protein
MAIMGLLGKLVDTALNGKHVKVAGYTMAHDLWIWNSTRTPHRPSGIEAFKCFFNSIRG